MRFRRPGSLISLVLTAGAALVVLALWTGTAVGTISNPAGKDFSATAGSPFSGVVATFESNHEPRAGFPATIDWGDGSQTQGSVSLTGMPNPNTWAYQVSGSHSYNVPGSYSFRVSITDAADQTTGQASGTATVTGPPTPPPPPSPPPPPQPPPPPPVVPADLAVTQTTTPLPPVRGQTLTTIVTVVNNGPGVATGVVATSYPPANSEFVSAAGPAPAACEGTNPVICSLGSLAVGASAAVTHVVRMTAAGADVASVGVSAQQPDPTPGNNTQSQALQVALPPPTPGQTVNAAPVRGTVLVRRRGSTQFEPMVSPGQVAVGSQFDVRRGRVALTSARDRRGGLDTAGFYDGIFTVLQTGTPGAFTELRLDGGSFRGCKIPARLAASSGKLRKRPVRRLWGDGKGRFRMRGRYSSAAIRGTIWLTQDRCDGTLTRVRRGSVVVLDFRRNRRVVVRAGGSYLARAPG